MSSPAAELLSFKIHGMDCAEEVAVLKQAVGPVVGGEDHLAFDILNGRMIVSRGIGGPPEAAIVQAVQATGMRAERWHEGQAAPTGSTLWERQGRTILSATSGLALVCGVRAACRRWRAASPTHSGLKA